MINWIKKNSLFVSLFFIIIGIICFYHSNSYDISSKTLSTIVDGKIDTKLIYQLDSTKLLLNIFANILLSLGIAIFISTFFIRYIEKDERDEFEKKLLSFQENTAKDAIQSVFKRFIDEEFFLLLKKELFNAKAIRRNANWQYDIGIENDKLYLIRTVNYEFHNISQDKLSEYIKISSNLNEHCRTEIVSGKIRYFNNDEEPIDIITCQEKGDNFITMEKEVTINPNESIEVVLVFKQFFNNGYIYETHTSRHSIINLEIIVNFPSDFDFDLFSSFSNDLRLKIDEPSKKVYVVKGAIFSGQGIEFICKKKISNQTLLSTI